MTNKNQYGYIDQKGTRYFCQVGATTHYDAGFKSLKQFNAWLKEEFEKHGLDWRAGNRWKYKDHPMVFSLVNRLGIEVK